MDSFTLSGLGIALVTPFDSDKNIDYKSLERVVRHVATGGADYLVVLGTTGETPTLDVKEKSAVRKFVRDLSKDYDIPLIAGLGSNNTRALVEEIRSVDLEGYSAILSVTPFYNKPSQEGLYQHYREVAENSNLPIILYNVPGRTGVNISAETTLRLADDYSNIIGIKEASGNFRQIEEIIHNCPEGFNVVSGDDALTYPLMSLGAVGVISVIGNAFPVEFGRMTRLCIKGEYSKALPIHYNFQRLYEELFRHGNPAGIKCLLHEMGLIENELRLPLVPTRLETSEKIQSLLNLIFKS